MLWYFGISNPPILKNETYIYRLFPFEGVRDQTQRNHMEEKNYTLTEKELFDLIEYEKYSSFCATIIKAVQEYNADSEMMTDLFEAFMRAIEIGKGLPPKTEEISDTFHKERMNKETTE